MTLAAEKLDPQDCANQILIWSGKKVESEDAAQLYEQILQHKWHLSEKLGRDVGIKVACLDYVENVNRIGDEGLGQEYLQVIREFGGHMIDPSVWETIAESQPPKQIVNRRIILPLTASDLARKHGVTPPRAILFFGPPGTGKTHFVRAIAGVLQWWYIEVSPSDLMSNGADRLGANLKRLMERIRDLDEAVIFIDEFEEIAGDRDNASRIDKSITNEFLKQVPAFKRQDRNSLLVCATNYIGDLDAALLRPGRFDCIIPVGGLDDQSRRSIFEYYLNATNAEQVDVDRIVGEIEFFTPADIEYLFQVVRQESFEKELAIGEDYRVATEDFTDAIKTIRPTLSDEITRKFEEDCKLYTRY